MDRIVAGMEGTPMVDSKSKSLVAYHEVGHAICATLTPGTAVAVPPDVTWLALISSQLASLTRWSTMA